MPAAMWNATGPLAIGRGMTTGNQVDFLYGDIDEVMVHTGALNNQEISGDFTGDGKADQVFMREDGPVGFHIFTLAGTDSGLLPPAQWYGLGPSATNADPRRVTNRVADFGGDGKADVVAYYDAGSGRRLWQWTSNGRSGPAAPSLWMDSTTCTGCATAMNSWADRSFVTGNVDGDTDTDLLAIRTTPAGQQFTL
ncbi:hypothetical protein Daura_34165 [Dactylosporangium aurantiacum]|uniref:VCBS repeat-containing protein n=2 Tax=Dactylosporangium aurantiacum TaxID=35754 RepID=A0A9Q9I9N5_9ACTN|nr:hypothetical protein Daura_34165 [Dactylosporangium aurantiacum]